MKTECRPEKKKSSYKFWLPSRRTAEEVGLIGWHSHRRFLREGTWHGVMGLPMQRQQCTQVLLVNDEEEHRPLGARFREKKSQNTSAWKRLHAMASGAESQVMRSLDKLYGMWHGNWTCARLDWWVFWDLKKKKCFQKRGTDPTCGGGRDLVRETLFITIVLTTATRQGRRTEPSKVSTTQNVQN